MRIFQAGDSSPLLREASEHARRCLERTRFVVPPRHPNEFEVTVHLKPARGATQLCCGTDFGPASGTLTFTVLAWAEAAHLESKAADMSNDWDFYFCRVDDNPASIFVDLGASKVAPLSQFPVLAHVRIYMQAPREDGLSSQAEFEALKSLEEDALESLQSESEASYVGRCTSDGCRDLYFYTRTGSHWEERVGRIMKDFPTYEFECGTRSDPAWTTYFTFLNPSDEDRERIENRRTCEVLEKKGDELATARPIDHWAYFPNPSLRRAFVEEAQALGYEVTELIDSGSEDERCGVRLSAVGLPSLELIDELTLPLFRAARAHAGEYDGWETQVVS